MIRFVGRIVLTVIVTGVLVFGGLLVVSHNEVFATPDFTGRHVTEPHHGTNNHGHYHNKPDYPEVSHRRW